MLRLFFSTWTAEYSLDKQEKLWQPSETQLYKNLKALSHFFVASLKSALNFEHLEKKMRFIADVFPKLETTKNVVT